MEGGSRLHVFRHRCLVCGRAYCRRCVVAGMGDMTEGRKCLDCLGRKYIHRYIHRAGRGATAVAGLLYLCCCALHAWGSSSSVRSQELLWAEKGAAPRRRPSSSSSTTSISTSYSTAAGGGYSASMSMGPVPFLCSSSSCCSRLDLQPRLVTRHDSPPAPPLTAGGDRKKNTTMAARGISIDAGPAVAVVGAVPETAVSNRNG